MEITLYGVGYVGLVTGVCLAHLGHSICCMDIDQKKIDMLEAGEIPIYEPGLERLLQSALKNGRIKFVSSIEKAINFSPIQMIAVGTPPKPNGGADLSQVDAVAMAIGQYSLENKFVVMKSTVPVGTANRVACIIRESLARRKVSFTFDVGSNPEFLREGSAVEDFLEPDRIIVGVNDEASEKKFQKIYKPLIDRGYPLISMDVRSSELTKYVANAFLATKISFMNDISQLCEKLDANIHSVKKGLSADSRISKEFLNSGCGFGGSCFPKDLLALQYMAKENKFESHMINATLKTNARHQRLLFDKVVQYFSGNIKDRTFAIWGLAFKPNTDDIRFASSRVVMELLWQKGAHVKAYDPIAMHNIKSIYNNQPLLKLCNNAEETLTNADALIILTEWNEFLNVDFDTIKKHLKAPVIFDGRNIYNLDVIKKAEMEYIGVGCNIQSRLDSIAELCTDKILVSDNLQVENA
jgi:UDPglucose 6-dehydrogenase